MRLYENVLMGQGLRKEKNKYFDYMNCRGKDNNRGQYSASWHHIKQKKVHSNRFIHHFGYVKQQLIFKSIIHTW